MYKSMYEIQKANERAGLIWFDRVTMKAFGTKTIEDSVTPTENGAFFITREAPYALVTEGRLDPMYTVRFCDSDGHIRTVSKFMEFTQYGDAKDFLQTQIGIQDEL